MLNFEDRVGPIMDLGEATYPPVGVVPQWYRDAKLGAFIHWGLFSVPAWAVAPGERPVPTEDAYAWHHYAEWYGNTVRIPGSPTWLRHQEMYGPGFSYEDFADHWRAEQFNASDVVATLAQAGARYIIPTTKHHEGFCLWNTATTEFNSARRGPRRDLIREFCDATRAARLKFGVYFSGALDWHASSFPAIESDTDLFRMRRNDSVFAQYAARQLDELIDQFTPDILWNDIEWPDGGKGGESFGLAALFKRYFAQVPDGAVNDRWGVPYHGFLTREYTDVIDTMPVAWESTRGLGLSFGYNQNEDPEVTLSGTDLIRMFVDVVAKGGNLLINVGPLADGTLPPRHRDALFALGQWLRTNGDAIYATRPWHRAGEPTTPVRYTQRDSTLYIHCLDPSVPHVALPNDLADVADAHWLGAGPAQPRHVGDDVVVDLPDAVRHQPVAVLAVTCGG